MSRRISEHIRSNVVGYIAIFMFALGGSAYATHTGGEKTISSIDIIDDEVFSADVANDTLAGGGLAAADLRPDSVGTSEVASNSIGTGDIQDGQVQNADLGPSSVTSDKVASSTLTGSDVATGGLFGSDIATDTVGSSDIGANAVGTSELAQVPGARARATNAQTIANDSSAIVNLNTEQFDTGGLYTAPDDNMTISVPGTYMLSGEVGYVADPHGSRLAEIRVNGDPVAVNQTAGTSPYSTRVPVSTIARLGAGNVVTLRAHHNAGNSLATGSYFGLGNAYLAVQWLSD